MAWGTSLFMYRVFVGLLHGFYWGLTFFAVYTFSLKTGLPPVGAGMRILSQLLVLVPFTYYTYLRLLPKARSRGLLWFLRRFLPLLVGVWALRWVLEGGTYVVLNVPGIPYGEWVLLFSILVTTLLAPLVFGMLFMIQETYRGRLATLKLVQQRQTLELEMLRRTLNPHLLFNALNTVYSLVYRQAPEAPEAILLLAELLRYMTYDCNQDRVSWQQEEQFLRNYLAFEGLKFGPETRVELSIAPPPPPELPLPPLLLLPLVENAFKHGCGGAQAWVRVRVAYLPGQLSFRVENPLPSSAAPQPTGGLGLANLRARLDTTLGLGRYQWAVGPVGGEFHAQVQIPYPLEQAPPSN